MLKKLTLGLIVSTLSFAALAEDWRVVPSKAGVTTKLDWDSIKTQTQTLGFGEESMYFDVRFKVEHQKPQTLKSGKYFTTAYFTLSVDCDARELAQTDFEWYINNIKTAENDQIPLSASWEEFQAIPRTHQLTAKDAEKYNPKSIRASYVCSQMIQ